MNLQNYRKDFIENLEKSNKYSNNYICEIDRVIRMSHIENCQLFLRIEDYDDDLFDFNCLNYLPNGLVEQILHIYITEISSYGGNINIILDDFSAFKNLNKIVFRDFYKINCSSNFMEHWKINDDNQLIIEKKSLNNINSQIIENINDIDITKHQDFKKDKCVQHVENIDKTSDNQNKCKQNLHNIEYKSFTIKKKNGGIRHLNKYVNYKDKLRHKRINNKVQGKYSITGYAFEGEQLYASVLEHKNSKSFINLDFSDFFNSLNVFDLDKNIFKSNEYQSFIECADNDGFLLQGTVLAPVIANILMAQFDKQMLEYAKQNKFVYTRYADDITISFKRCFVNKTLDKKVIEITTFINQLLNDKDIFKYSNITLNDKKTRYTSFKYNNHYKLLSWNIIRGKDGKDNYITAGRKSKKRGYYGYQKYGIKNSESILLNKKH